VDATDFDLKKKKKTLWAISDEILMLRVDELLGSLV